MRLEPESAWEEVERRIALAEIAGPLSFSPEALARLSAISRRTKYTAGAKIADNSASRVQLLMHGDLRVERDGRVFGEARMGNPLMLLWLARDSHKRQVSTEQGADVIELPVDGLEAIVEDDLWTPIARRISMRILEMPATIGRCEGCTGHELGDRLGALMRAMPFASRYLDALMQLDEDAELVHVEHDPWKTNEPVSAIYVPLTFGVPRFDRDKLAGLGAIELLAQKPRTGELPAHGPYDALRIDEETLFDVLEDHPELARDLLATLAAFVVARLEQP